ncbi:MAG: hypothetical protein C7B46_07395 [Sulfobacillus benefaciens]|uniref:L,D-TPase catalytic domain-containing protein n=1 Tax=Sulfobacillus benefaciens TaxID=453960 RepID=A0A2T2XHE1_9FIRM|nr:MAG: hypothetical protein C7B46_07395 [Sulfobacillus benefaciens]
MKGQRRLLMGLLVVVLAGSLLILQTRRSPLTAATSHTHIIINVVQRKLYLYVGNKLFSTYPVAVGKPETPSPRGEFFITQKAVWGDGFGTRWMRLSTPWGIYGIHGTNKPWSVGTVASHGCFRMLNRDVEQVYALVSVGTPVTIEGITPFVRIRRPLMLGNIGEDVVELQRLLRLAKVYKGPLEGIYNQQVVVATEKFQLMVHLPVDGVATMKTISALQELTHQTGLHPGYLSRSLSS